MKRDVNQFRERFNRWKSGELVYSSGRPVELKEVVITPDLKYNLFLNTLPDNQRLAPESEYTTHRYWELNGKPKNFKEALERKMYYWDSSDLGYHGNSIAYDKDGTGYFMKPDKHKTVKYELDYYRDGTITEQGGVLRRPNAKEYKEWKEFRKNYKLVPDLDRPGFHKYQKYNNGKTSLRIPKFDDGKPKYKTDLVLEIPEVTIIAKRKKEDPTAIILNPLIKPGFDKNPFAMPTLEEFILSNLRRYMPGMFSVGLKNINPLYKQLMYPKFDEGKPDDTDPDDIQTNIPEDLMESFYKDHPELQITPLNNPDYEGAFNMAKLWLLEAWLPNRLRYELQKEYDIIDNRILVEAYDKYKRDDKQFIEFANNFSLDPYLENNKDLKKMYKTYMKQNPDATIFQAMKQLSDWNYMKENNITAPDGWFELYNDFKNFLDKSYYFTNAERILADRQAIRKDIEDRYNNAFDILNKAKYYNPLDHPDDYINNQYLKNHPNAGAWVYHGGTPDYTVYVNPNVEHDSNIWDYNGIASQMLHELNHMILDAMGLKGNYNDTIKYGYLSLEIDSRIRQFLKYAQLDPAREIHYDELLELKKKYADDEFYIFSGGLSDDLLMNYLNDRQVNIRSTRSGDEYLSELMKNTAGSGWQFFFDKGKSSLNIPKFKF